MLGNKRRPGLLSIVSLCIVQLAIVFIASFNRLLVTPVSRSCCGLAPVIGRLILEMSLYSLILWS